MLYWPPTIIPPWMFFPVCTSCLLFCRLHKAQSLGPLVSDIPYPSPFVSRIFSKLITQPTPLPKPVSFKTGVHTDGSLFYPYHLPINPQWRSSCIVFIYMFNRPCFYLRLLFYPLMLPQFFTLNYAALKL